MSKSNDPLEDEFKKGFDAGFSSGLREGKRLHETLVTSEEDDPDRGRIIPVTKEMDNFGTGYAWAVRDLKSKYSSQSNSKSEDTSVDEILRRFANDIIQSLEPMAKSGYSEQTLGMVENTSIEKHNEAKAKINHLLERSKLEARIDELKSISGFSLGEVYTVKNVDKSKKNWSPVPINDRIEELNKELEKE